MKINFNANFNFEMSRGELREIGSMIRTFIREERKNARNRGENRSQIDRAPQRERGTEPRPQISECVERERKNERAEKQRKLDALLKEVEALKNQLK